jgi:hypothetical protein
VFQQDHLTARRWEVFHMRHRVAMEAVATVGDQHTPGQVTALVDMEGTTNRYYSPNGNSSLRIFYCLKFDVRRSCKLGHFFKRVFKEWYFIQTKLLT